MSGFDFDEIVNRRCMNSYKWDIAENEVPMWVADMDFKTAPAVVEAIVKRALLGVYGYNVVPDEWYDSIIGWWSKRHGFSINRDWLIFCTGILPAITSCVKRISNIGDNVLCQTPVYDMFFHSIENTGRHVIESSLVYENGEYRFDMVDLENKLSHPLTTMMILCNPHNPSGYIWSREELKHIGMLCDKYHVTVISDEIHCDIMDPGYEYVPYASASELCKNKSITCISASKAFNIAGLQTAAVIVPDERLRNIIERGLNSDEVAEPNSFATDAVVAAFTKGEEWLDELNKYIYENKQYVNNFIKENIPKLHIVDSHSTYLLWIDITEIGDSSDEIGDYLRKTTGLYMSPGSHYRGDGDKFLRMNLACPRSQVSDACDRLKNGVNKYIAMHMV